MCEWGNDEVWNWGPDISQMYRISMDHLPFFHWPDTASGAGYVRNCLSLLCSPAHLLLSVLLSFYFHSQGCGTAEIIEWMADLHPSKYTKQNAWMDPDFLETLFPVTMNFTHSRTEFTFWTVRNVYSTVFLLRLTCCFHLSLSVLVSPAFSYGVHLYLFQRMFVIYLKKRNPF
jgi:hypothetical protein